jgi:ATP-binding cassette subfamily F protein uup
LLRVLAGEMAPDAGTIARAEGLRVVAFDQDRRQLDRGAILRRALAPNADEVVYRDRTFHISAWAKRFLFRPEQLDQSVSALSGGEQARILIAQLMLQPADVLLLDEPTNDLDLATLEVLEESLAGFPGAVVLVTHDRSLLDRLCTDILGLDGQGRSALFADYTQWAAAQQDAADAKPTSAASSPKASRASRGSDGRLSYREQREWDDMEARILAAEQALADRQQEVEAAGQGADHVRLQEACRALQTAQEAVEKLYGRWQELETKQKRPSSSKP